MTRMLCLLPDDQSAFLLESPLEAEEVIAAVNLGGWRLPLDEDLAENSPSARFRLLKARRFGSLVIVTATAEQPFVTGSQVQNSPPSPDGSARTRLAPIHLSQRQRQVLQGLADGLTSRQIGVRLGITQRTVFHHISILKSRFGTNTLAESIHRAAELGLLGNPPNHVPG